MRGDRKRCRGNRTNAVNNGDGDGESRKFPNGSTENER